MKRFLGIIVGLSLGWFAAGYVFASPAVEKSADHHAQVSTEHGEEHHGPQAASQITHGAIAGAPWLPGVLIGAAGLFGAGIFVNLVGWANPDPVVEAADHGHDHH